MASTLDNRGITPFLFTQNMRYQVSVYPRVYFSVFIFNTTSASFCRTFFSAFRWSVKFSLVIIMSLSTHTCTISNTSNSLDIFSWNISGILYMPIGSVGTCTFPGKGHFYRAVFLWGIILYASIPYWYTVIMNAWIILALSTYIVFCELELGFYGLSDSVSWNRTKI